jgi:hypothetical protein
MLNPNPWVITLPSPRSRGNGVRWCDENRRSVDGVQVALRLQRIEAMWGSGAMAELVLLALCEACSKAETEIVSTL